MSTATLTGSATTVWTLSDNLVFGEWVELPLIGPHHLLAARLIKHTFTGDLEAEIAGTIPPFSGTEAHYLRAQIVRIAFNTQIAPANVYKPSEKGGRIMPDA